MSQATTDQDTRGQQQWRHIALALLLGFISFNFWEAFEIALDTPIGPTAQAIPLVVSAGVFGIISFYLLRLDFKVGYILAILTGLAGIGGLALVRAGVIGSVKPGTPPIGVVVYLAVAGLIVITGYLAWRNRSA